MNEEPDALAFEKISLASLIVRGKRVLLDSDLAALYGVTTKALNQAIKRNAERFPRGFHVSYQDQRDTWEPVTVW